MEHYLHGGHNYGLWLMPGILERCEIPPVTNDIFENREDHLLDIINEGPADFHLHELDPDYTPRLLKTEAAQLQERFGFFIAHSSYGGQHQQTAQHQENILPCPP